MSETSKWAELAGTWTGTNKLWLMPTDPVRESQANATVTFAAGCATATIHYTWAYEDQPKEGVLVIRTQSGGDDDEVVMIDSFHTAGKFMTFKNDKDHEGLCAVRGSYSAPPGPDWGWRIVVDSDSPDAFKITMFNITPDGQEAPAVEASYTRS